MYLMLLSNFVQSPAKGQEGLQKLPFRLAEQGPSIKGESAIDWSDRKARGALLTTIVADADRLLEMARQAQVELPEGSPEREGIVAAAELLGQLLLQSLPPAPNGHLSRIRRS